MLESSVYSKTVEEVIYTLVSEMQHQRKAALTTILGTRDKQGFVRGVRTVVGPFGGLLFNYLQETVSFK